MTQRSSPSPKKAFPIIPVFVLGLVVVLLFVAGGFGFAAAQESHDSFCASCHTQPESTFFERSTAAQAVDLASFHTPKNTACIDCHSGEGVMGRLQAELLGAKNAFKWYSGTAIQPASLTVPVSDQNCLKCHPQVTQKNFSPKEKITIPSSNSSGRGGTGKINHWHTFMARWQAAASAGGCVSCHSGHTNTGTAQNGFMVAQNVQQTCNACHQAIRKED